MSRRMDREGMYRMEPQGILNRRYLADPRCVEDERGWVQPFTNQQGWQELNSAIYALQCLLRWTDLGRRSRLRDRARVDSDLRTFHFSLARSRKCDRPVLP